MDQEHLSKDQQILVVMRKVLSAIVRETTPQPGMRHPLSEGTIDDIRQCFGLISAREKELADEAGIENNMRPRYVDEPETNKVVSISKIGKIKKQEDE
jgi:hypothetical protein